MFFILLVEIRTPWEQKAYIKVAGGKFLAFWCAGWYRNAKHLGSQAEQIAKQYASALLLRHIFANFYF